MRINLEHLRTLYEVVKAGSITKAAIKLRLSQPSVSRTIGILEERLKLKLFDRTSRGLSIRLEGERMFEFAARMIEELDALAKMLQYMKEDEAVGELRIAATPTFSSIWLSENLAGFMEEYPKMRPRIITKVGDFDILDVDVAIRTFMHNRPHLIQRPLKSSTIFLWASEEYLKKHGMPKQPEDLNQHSLLSFGGNTINPYGSYSWILDLGISPDCKREPLIEVNSTETLIKLAEKGLGIIETAEDFIKLKAPSLVKVLPDHPGPSIPLYYIYHERLRNSKRVLALQDYLEKLIGPQDKPKS